MQKHINHHHHQHNRFQQRVHHFFHRSLHKRHAVLAGLRLDAIRKIRLHIADARFHRRRHFQRIGTISQHNRQRTGVATVELVLHIGAFRRQFHPRHVFNPHRGAAAAAFENNVFKLRRRLQLAARLYRHIEHLPGHRRQLAELAGRHLHILPLDGAAHIGGHQLVLF